MIPLIPAVISAIPSLIKLFTSDNKTDAVIDLATKAGEALGLEGSKRTPEDIIAHLEANPDAVIKLKELELNATRLELEHERATVAELNRHNEAKDKSITDRWSLDNAIGGINAVVRPYSLIYLLFVVTIFALIDGNIEGFSIKDVWVTLFTGLAISAFNAYFILRTFDKHSKNKHKGK